MSFKSKHYLWYIYDRRLQDMCLVLPSSLSPWWYHDMNTALFTLCAGNPSGAIGFPTQKAIMQSCAVSFLSVWIHFWTNSQKAGTMRASTVVTSPWCHGLCSFGLKQLVYLLLIFCGYIILFCLCVIFSHRICPLSKLFTSIWFVSRCLYPCFSYRPCYGILGVAVLPHVVCPTMWKPLSCGSSM